MEIVQIPINEVVPATYNPRKIDQESMNRLIDNIRTFGLVDPLIVNHDMTLIGGHQRLKACQALEFETVPCVILNLGKDDERLLNISLNKIGGDFDGHGLKQLLIELDSAGQDLSLSGFDSVEIEKLLLPPRPPQIENWDLSDVAVPFWLVIRGPLGDLPEIKKALVSVDLSGCQVESSV